MHSQVFGAFLLYWDTRQLHVALSTASRNLAPFPFKLWLRQLCPHHVEVQDSYTTTPTVHRRVSLYIKGREVLWPRTYRQCRQIVRNEATIPSRDRSRKKDLTEKGSTWCTFLDTEPVTIVVPQDKLPAAFLDSRNFGRGAVKDRVKPPLVN